MTTRLGEPGTTLGGTVEAPVIHLETAPQSGVFAEAPWLGPDFKVHLGANDDVPTAEVAVNLADVPAWMQAAYPPRDWQVRISGANSAASLANVWTAALGGKRLRIRTNRPSDNWLIFEGFVDRVAPGWQHSKRKNPRWATAYATSTLIVADRLLSQRIIGQWRRSRDAERRVRLGESGEESRVCVRVPVPLVANPGGRPNCHPTPLVLPCGSKVYLPTDPDDPRAIPFTVAKLLRYLQWAALQEPPPEPDWEYPERYDLARVWEEVQLTGDEATPWTNYGLQIAGLNDLLAPYLDLAPADLVEGNWAHAALLRAVPDLSLNLFSVLEACSHVCARVGMLMHSWFELATEGEQEVSRTRVGFAIRGKRRFDSQDPVGLGRGVSLFVESDRTTHAPGTTDAERLAATNAFSGDIVLDEAVRRTAVRVLGGPTEYEMSIVLRPGWTPNADFDVDPDNAAAVDAALANVRSAQWLARYVSGAATPGYRPVGRYWVANEDGAFVPGTYKRQYGPWSTDAIWAPLDFRTECQVQELAQRGANGWSARRRRFLPTTGTDRFIVSAAPVLLLSSNAAPFGVLVELSLDGGANWDAAPNWSFTVEQDRMAIRITTANLWEITSPKFPGENYVSAYIKGTLRIRVTADVEGDDYAYGYAPTDANDPAFAMPWCEVLDRGDQYRRCLRAGANSVLQPLFPFPGPRDDTEAAEQMARRIRNELRLRHHSGRVTIPYLLRPQDGVDWPTYQIGDEIDDVVTGVDATRLTFAESWASAKASPRVMGIDYQWPQSTTTLVLEDARSSPDSITPLTEQEMGWAQRVAGLHLGGVV